MYAALVTLEGVVKNERDAPIAEGRLLVEALRLAGVRVTLITSSSDAQVTHWMKVNQVTVDAVIDSSVVLDPDEPLWRRQVAVARSQGQVNLVFDADPENVAWALSEGLTAVLVAHPRHMLPKARPQGVRRPWGSITAELDRQVKTAPVFKDEIHRWEGDA